MNKLTEKDLLDFMYGATIYGTGGGGSVEGAKSRLEDAIKKKKEFKLVDTSEIPDDAIIACPYGVGGGVREEIRKRFASLPRLPPQEVVSNAINAFESVLGKEVYGFVPGELGAGNAFLAMYMAALGDRYIVDGDTVGRSVPEVPHSTYTICDIDITPYVIASPFGDVMIVTKVLNDMRAEDIDRFMAVASGGGVTVIDHPVTGKVIRESIILNTVTKSIEVGKAIRKANAKGTDPVDAVVESTGGYVLFNGKIEGVEREGREGFIWGEAKLGGIGDFKGRTYKVWFKNENLMTWLDGEVHVTCPDLVSMVCPETGHALSNWGDDLEKNREVAVIGIKAPAMWRTKKGLELLSPKYFGFDVEYRPIETIV